MLNSTLREKFNFYFSGVFYKYWKNLYEQEDQALFYNFGRFCDFPDFS